MVLLQQQRNFLDTRNTKFIIASTNNGQVRIFSLKYICFFFFGKTIIFLIFQLYIDALQAELDSLRGTFAEKDRAIGALTEELERSTQGKILFLK